MTEVPRVLTMAREIRRGEANHTPNEMYRAAGGDGALYSHAMREAAFVVPNATSRAEAVCAVCGFDFGQDAPRRATVERDDAITEERLLALIRRAAPFVNAVVARADDKTKGLAWLADAAVVAGNLRPVPASSPEGER